MNIYLDIDGVLLADEDRIASYLDEFLREVFKKHPSNIYLLSHEPAVTQDKLKKILLPQLESTIASTLDLINLATWKEMKTEAIDFEKDFLWFDDDIWPEELQTLEDNNATHRFVMVDLKKDPNMLKQLLVLL